MEKNTWNKTFKEDDGDGSKPWGYRKLFHGDDLYSGFSWPPRSYTCSFCKREFRSAQALGGHMNVHRRDRARLRQYSPPWEAQSTVNPNPNPSPSFSTFSPSPRLYTFPSISSFSSPSTTNPSSTKMKSPSVGNNSVVDPLNSKEEDLSKTMKTLKDFMEEEECKTKKGKMVMLDLEIGVGSKVTEDLDLELRLGYS